MSCCGGGSSKNGAFPKRHESGCNCSGAQRHTGGSDGYCEPETTRYQSRGRRETTPQGPTGGCGRPGCPRIVYPAPEPPDVEWEYTNYNRNNHRWPSAAVQNDYPGYEDDYAEEMQAYQSDNYEEFEGDEKVQEDCVYYDELNDNSYQEPYERFGGGCENFEENGQSYLDYYYEKEPVDQQKPNSERVLQGCRRCSESRSTTDSDTDDNRERRRVHF